MQFKHLGPTKLKLFPIGFGAGFSVEEYKNQREIVNILKLAVSLGINLIDTAENYGNGLSEKLIGRAIRKQRKKLILATKFSPENSSYKGILKSCEGSLKRLNTDYIDIYQFHWSNPNTPFEESIKALEKLKKDGKIKNFGVGNFTKKELDEILKLTDPKNIVSLQTEFNLHEQYIKNSKLLNKCIKNNISIICYSPLDQGRVEFMNKAQINLIDKLTKKYNKSISQIILNWESNNTSLIPIPKTLNSRHLIENSQSPEFKMDSNEYLEIDKTFSPKINYIKTSDIIISQKGERGKSGYQTLKEALENKDFLVPTPKDLADNIGEVSSFKPVRLVPANAKSTKYFLINGRVRYWAWVIKFGNKKPIPCYIRNY